jgi:hypothetical protein
MVVIQTYVNKANTRSGGIREPLGDKLAPTFRIPK